MKKRPVYAEHRALCKAGADNKLHVLPFPASRPPHRLPADVDNSALWLYLLYGLSRDVIGGITLCLSLYIQSPASQSLTVFTE